MPSCMIYGVILLVTFLVTAETAHKVNDQITQAEIDECTRSGDAANVYSYAYKKMNAACSVVCVFNAANSPSPDVAGITVEIEQTSPDDQTCTMTDKIGHCKLGECIIP